MDINQESPTRPGGEGSGALARIPVSQRLQRTATPSAAATSAKNPLTCTELAPLSPLPLPEPVPVPLLFPPAPPSVGAPAAGPVVVTRGAAVAKAFTPERIVLG